MENAFVTYIGTDNYLPGALALNKSLKMHNTAYDLIAMVSESVSDETINLLTKREIKTKIVKQIKNPNNLVGDKRGFEHIYTKLNLFDMIEFAKIVYIDADMLVCNNIESLFDLPHMSAVTAGSLVPENKSWKELNAGLMVIEPSRPLFMDIELSVNDLHSADASDQGFLHSFYKDWPINKDLHLDHTFNTPFCYLEEYCRLYDFKFTYKRRSLDTNVSVIHYWGRHKPWEIDNKILKRRSNEKWEQALILWWDTYLAIYE